ncbi:hypothetical protein ACFQI7_22980 [Paenibacillus allorhizosphaerae]|uniref:DUF4872 domain-containing protein n=1 Tax=Paenibacillus allorhizosphaerae TaxID=2849866 RepID=A0ABM8VR00_9BACL|nr:hypothetical protein [Paenibacillus allorhizosphaerae]CAG7654815.1 hypothetical protein PAECIP111802_05891 [Paenibacillus allorhizosphaerae]
MNPIINVQLEQSPTKIATTMHAVLQSTDKAKLSLSEVMRYTSHAFRINVRSNTIETDSLYRFHGGQSLRRGFLALGFKPLNLCPPVKTITPTLLTNIIDTIRERMCCGIPVVGWDFFSKQFGVIYGLDDEKQILYVKDSKRDGAIPYEQLPNRRILCLASVQESLNTDRQDMFKMALEAILDHAYSRDGLSFINMESGFRGYDAWLEAFISGNKIRHKGNALNIHILSDARRHATAFLEIVSKQWEDHPCHGELVSQMAKEAASSVLKKVPSLMSTGIKSRFRWWFSACLSEDYGVPDHQVPIPKINSEHLFKSLWLLHSLGVYHIFQFTLRSVSASPGPSSR